MKEEKRASQRVEKKKEKETGQLMVAAQEVKQATKTLCNRSAQMRKKERKYNSGVVIFTDKDKQS